MLMMAALTDRWLSALMMIVAGKGEGDRRAQARGASSNLPNDTH